jgi:formylglycine-generating enzyme required for sulfatase activity
MEGGRFAFTDGTVLRGQIKEGTLTIKTRFGEVPVPVSQIKTMPMGKEKTTVTPTSGSIFEIQNGDVIVGELSEPLIIELAFGSTLAVPPTEQVSFTGERFSFPDGTIVKGKIAQETVAVTTRFGGLRIPGNVLKVIKFAQEAVAGGAQASVQVPVDMVLVPAREFRMGSNEGDADEKPVHQVYLDAFYIDKYEVTNALYEKFMQATGRQAPVYWNDKDYNTPNQPVVGVSWHDAEAYCQWAGKRLPTEAEWEKAARGTDGRIYPWGNQWEERKANSSGTADGYQYTAPVGSFETGKSPYGAYDMAGNVWEWVADWYAEKYYQGSPARNPTGPESGQSRVLRGGAWHYNQYYVRASSRNRIIPGHSSQCLGSTSGCGARRLRNPLCLYSFIPGPPRRGGPARFFSEQAIAASFGKHHAIVLGHGPLHSPGGARYPGNSVMFFLTFPRRSSNADLVSAGLFLFDENRSRLGASLL